MSAELLDYIQAIKPSFGDAKRVKISLLLMHYITLARVSDGRVRIDNVLTTSGGSFLPKVLRNMSSIRGLAFALKLDMTCTFDDNPVPKDLRRQCQLYNIDVEACVRRNKKIQDARAELWDLVIFVKVALAVMAALHEDTLNNLDESYRGHRQPSYKPKSKWLGLVVDESTPAVRARDLPRAGAPRPVTVKTAAVSNSIPGPIRMTRKTTDSSSASSSTSPSGLKSTAYKHARPGVPRPTPAPVTSRPTRAHAPISSSIPSQATYYAQCAAMAAYQRTMQQGMASRRMC
ncbi:hypothetical protein FRC11_013773 [Ceratobasidium sp. 423]|nr:hypothetical protein FRC11_013773 [Ceratobasidium sp. 423]